MVGEETLDLALIVLSGGIFAEHIVDAADDVLRVDLVAETGEEIDVVLRRAGQVKDGEANGVAELEEKLFEAAAGARGGRIGLPRPPARGLAGPSKQRSNVFG
jgi:hypothetical protein